MSNRGMVVAPQPLAVEAGVEILRRGGNAVDAAIATAFAQGVVDPHMAGVGGFGSMLVYSAAERRPTMVDFHGRAGSRAMPDMFADAVQGRIVGHAERYLVRGYVNQIGYRAVSTPGTVAGLHTAWQRFGRLPWPDLLQPAIRLAREGFQVLGDLLRRWEERPEPGHVDSLTRFLASPESARIFLKEGRLPDASDRLVQPDYARTLELIARGGAEVFYRGEIAERIVEDFRANGGLITREDLEGYRVDVYQPVRGSYRGYEIASSPPPGSGVQVIQILKLLEGYDLGTMEHGEAPYVELVARAQKLSFLDRARHLGDPRFLEVPMELFLSGDRAAELRGFIDRRELPEEGAHELPESSDTTQVTVADGEGNCVSLTHTLGSASGVVTPGLGFTYNNCMYQFDPIPGHPNSIQPGKARITGISPTMLLREGRPILVVGAPGGTRILGAVQHTINNVIDHGMTAVEAVSAPRWHWEAETLDLEPRLYYHVRARLEARGLKLRCAGFGYDPAFARAHAILIDPTTGRISGGADPRGGGCASSA